MRKVIALMVIAGMAAFWFLYRCGAEMYGGRRPCGGRHRRGK